MPALTKTAMWNRTAVLMTYCLGSAVALRLALKHVDVAGSAFVVLALLPPMAAAAVLAANHRTRGTKLALVGVLLNLLVMSANGGLMPAFYEGGDCAGQTCVPESKLSPARHVSGTNARLSLLADRFEIPQSDGRILFSVGDVALAAGLLWMTAATILSKPPWRRDSKIGESESRERPCVRPEGLPRSGPTEARNRR